MFRFILDCTVDSLLSVPVRLGLHIPTYSQKKIKKERKDFLQKARQYSRYICSVNPCTHLTFTGESLSKRIFDKNH